MSEPAIDDIIGRSATCSIIPEKADGIVGNPKANISFDNEVSNLVLNHLNMMGRTPITANNDEMMPEMMMPFSPIRR